MLDMIPEVTRRSERPRQAPVRYGFMVTEGDDAEIVDSEDPATFAEAMGSSDSETWLRTMKEEMKSMHDMDGVPQTYQARLVTKGFSQIQGVDCEETF